MPRLAGPRPWHRAAIDPAESPAWLRHESCSGARLKKPPTDFRRLSARPMPGGFLQRPPCLRSGPGHLPRGLDRAWEILLIPGTELGAAVVVSLLILGGMRFAAARARAACDGS